MVQRFIMQLAADGCQSAANVQTRLTIGEPDDPYEREADQTAERVMAMLDTTVVGRRSSVHEVQRKPG